MELAVKVVDRKAHRRPTIGHENPPIVLQRQSARAKTAFATTAQIQSAAKGEIIQDAVLGNYRIIKKLGSGSFGDIFYGVDIMTKEEVAIKIENVDVSNPQLPYENRVYKHIEKGIGIPRIKWFGKVGEFHMLVMDLLGPSLEDLFIICNQKFTVPTVLMIGDQLITRLEYLHSKGVLHRDMKPDNCLMGVGTHTQRIYLIDFGLSKKFRDTNGTHIPWKDGKSMVGTARYASTNAHRGCEQSRRDDLIALGYILLYFLRGSLPWQGLRAANRHQKYEKIAELKYNTTISDLCYGQPDAFYQYMKYVTGLQYETSPDYTYCRLLFRRAFREADYPRYTSFDWIRTHDHKTYSPFAH